MKRRGSGGGGGVLAKRTGAVTPTIRNRSVAPRGGDASDVRRRHLNGARPSKEGAARAVVHAKKCAELVDGW